MLTCCKMLRAWNWQRSSVKHRPLQVLSTWLTNTGHQFITMSIHLCPLQLAIHCDEPRVAAKCSKSKVQKFQRKVHFILETAKFHYNTVSKKASMAKNSQIHPAVSIKHLTFDRQTDRHRHRVIANTAVAWHYGGENWLNSEFRTRTIRKYPYFSIYRLC